MSTTKKEEENKGWKQSFDEYKPYIAGGAIGGLGAYGAYKFVPLPALYRYPISAYGGVMAGQKAYQDFGGKLNEGSKIPSYLPYAATVPGAVFAANSVYNWMYPPRRYSYFPFV